jgi:hypothetical protein
MAPPNLSPEARDDLANLFFALSQDPKTRKEIGRLVRKARPDTPHAMAFKDVEIEERFESFEEQQAAKEQKRQNDEILSRMNAQRARLLSAAEEGGRQYSEDDVKKIEALMQRKGITDYEDGATLYAATLPPVDPRPGEEPVPQHGATWEFPAWDQFSKDPQAASRNEAHAAITELMRKRR